MHKKLVLIEEMKAKFWPIIMSDFISPDFVIKKVKKCYMFIYQTDVMVEFFKMGGANIFFKKPK